MGCQILKEVAMQSVLIFQRIRNQTSGMPSDSGQVTNNIVFDEKSYPSLRVVYTPNGAIPPDKNYFTCLSLQWLKMLFLMSIPEK